jgi:cell division protein FtsW (lipid II flippase)
MNHKALSGMTLILTFLMLAVLSYVAVNAQNSSNAFSPATSNLYFFAVLAGIIIAAVITAVVIIFCAPPDVLSS